MTKKISKRKLAKMFKQLEAVECSQYAQLDQQLAELRERIQHLEEFVVELDEKRASKHKIEAAIPF